MMVETRTLDLTFHEMGPVTDVEPYERQVEPEMEPSDFFAGNELVSTG